MAGRMKSLTYKFQDTGDSEAGRDKYLTKNNIDHTGSQACRAEQRDSNTAEVRTHKARRDK